MRILVTRPHRDATRLAQRLRRRGHSVWIAPMLRMTFNPAPRWPASAPAALAVTSANGIDALVAAQAQFSQSFGRSVTDLRLFAVGKKTARAAMRAGWRDVTTAAGNVESLAQSITAACPSGTVWHISGEAQAGDLVAALQTAKIKARRVKLYDAEKTTILPRHIATSINQIEAVVLYSLRSAEAFLALVPNSRPMPLAFCLSEKIAAEMKRHGYATAVAAAPEDEHMIALIDDWRAG
jgi:uroporphyrinogen-III synthase